MKLNNVFLASVCCMLVFTTCNEAQKKEEGVVLKTFHDSLSYGLGVNFSMTVKQRGFDSLNVEALSQAVKDMYAGNPLILDEVASGEILNKFFQAQQMKQMQSQQSEMDGKIQEAKAFLEANREKAKNELITLPSGMQVMIMKEGDGPSPSFMDKVTTHYHGTLQDGTVFDSSVERGEPASFPVNGVIPGWQEALQLMKVGGKWKLVVPPHMAYGERSMGDKIPANSTLVFEVELLSIP